MAKDTSVRAIKDDADYLLDVDFNRIQQDEFNLGVFDGADESFLGFWKHLREYCIERTCRQEQNRSPEILMEDCSMGEGDDDDDDDNDNDDDNDPQYELVLNNLMQCGKAYSLQAEKDDGTIMHIRYEEQEGVIDEPRRKGPGRPRGSLNKAKDDLGSSKSQFATRNFDVGETAALRSSPRFSKNSSSCKERDTELATTNSNLRENNAPRSSPRISENSSRKRKQPEFATTNSNVRIAPSSSPRISGNTLPRRDTDFATRNSNVREKIASRSGPRVLENASRKEKHTTLATRKSNSKEKSTRRFSPRLAENASLKERDTELATRNSSFRQKDAPRFSPRIAETLSRKERDNVVNNHQAPNVYHSSRRNSQQASKAAQMSDYIYFLNNLKVLGGSPVFDYKGTIVRYEEIGEQSDSGMGPVADPPNYDVGRQATPTVGKDLSSDPESGAAADPTTPRNTGRQPTPKYHSSDPKIAGPADLATPCNTGRRPTPKTGKNCSPDPKIGAAACPAAPCNTGRQPIPEAGTDCSSDPKVGAAVDPATPCNTEKQPTPEVGKECSCDPKIGPAADPAMPCDTGRQPTPKVDSKKFNYPHSHKSAQSSFRSLVISELKKPYDQAELESFKAEAYRQRRIERHRESRRAISKSVKVDQLGKSYIDLYPELGEKIKAAKGDPRRTLTLLRGFFFWLQCLTKDGAFYPWEDPDCLEVLPESN